jgi:membrane associated rhomboid family serine protease
MSLGASTMVFAALGILGVFALNNKSTYQQRGMRRWLPFISTAALLALTGTAGEKTDVLAHLSGYICGVASGVFWLAIGKPQIVAKKQQRLFALASIVTLLMGWGLALANA